LGRDGKEERKKKPGIELANLAAFGLGCTVILFFGVFTVSFPQIQTLHLAESKEPSSSLLFFLYSTISIAFWTTSFVTRFFIGADAGVERTFFS